jgi:phospholipid/cholesterol/gamma-HCH transport system substrate-binding protein
MTTTRHLVLGIFLLLSLSVLGYYTLFMTEFRLMGETHERTIYFEQAGGLRAGDAVLVAGMRWGKVQEMTFNPNAESERRVTLRIVLDEPIRLHEGFDIVIEDATILGGKLLAIDPGPAAAPLIPEDAVLFGRVMPNAIIALGELIDQNSQPLTDAIAGMEELVRGVRDGRGILGRLANDDHMADNFATSLEGAAKAFTAAGEVAERINNGEGTIGLLVNDDALYREAESVASSLNDILADVAVVTTQVREGQGTIGRLVMDVELGRNVADAVRAIKEIAMKVNRGEGTLGALLTKDEVYNDLRQVSEDLVAVSQALRHAEGSLGKFIMDDELYDEARNALGILTRSLEEYREAAPITTFTSVLFTAF